MYLKLYTFNFFLYISGRIKKGFDEQTPKLIVFAALSLAGLRAGFECGSLKLLKN